MIDAWKSPNAENFDIKQSFCASLEGGTDSGTLSSTITLINDCQLSFTLKDTVAGGVLGNSTNSGFSIYFFSTTHINVVIDSVAHWVEISGITGVFDIKRVGSTLTVYRNNEVEGTVECNTYPIAINRVGQQWGASAITGQFCDLRLKDATQDYHFPTAEGKGQFSFSTNYLNDGIRITWDTTVENTWAVRQNFYHRNAVDGWWEIDGDDTKYPYPVAGFTTFHKGGMFTDAESSFAAETFPVGTPNGLDDIGTLDNTVTLSDNMKISFYADVRGYGAYDGCAVLGSSLGNSHWMFFYNPSEGVYEFRLHNGFPTMEFVFDGEPEVGYYEFERIGTTATLTTPSGIVITITCDEDDFVFNKLFVSPWGDEVFNGVVRDIHWKDANNDTLVPIDEGEGLELHDSKGTIIGTFDITIPTFWEGAPMVSKSLMAIEAIRALPYLTDGGGYPVPKTQQELFTDNVINYDDQYFRKLCENGNIEYMFFKYILEGDDLLEAQEFCCTEAQIPYVPPYIDFVEQQKLLASDGLAGDLLGEAVSIDGDTCVVGAYKADIEGLFAPGAAYVFTRTDGIWTEQQKLTAPDFEASDYFGYRLSLSGDTCAIGAYKEDPEGISAAGSVYVFTRTGSIWSFQQKLTAPDMEANADFGADVSIYGDTIVCGSYADDDPIAGANTGSAYVFTRTGSVWAFQQKLVAPDMVAVDNFGRYVSIHEDTCICGSILSDEGGENVGAAYVFTRAGTVWSFQQKLIGSAVLSGDYFGKSCNVRGDLCVIGATGSDVGGSGSGCAYVFARTGTVWTEQQILYASNPSDNDTFGMSVSVEGDTIVVAAYSEDTGFNNAGAAYIFKYIDDTWVEKQMIQGSDLEAEDSFGRILSMSGNTIVVGTYHDDDMGADAGAAYIFTQELE